MKTWMFAGLLALSACCQKKKCPEPELPRVHLLLIDQPSGYRVVVKEFCNGALADSVVYTDVGKEGGIGIDLTPFSDFDNSTAAGKKYVIEREGRRDEISDFSAIFKLEKRVCRKCLFSTDTEESWAVYEVGFSHGDSTVKNAYPYMIRY